MGQRHSNLSSSRIASNNFNRTTVSVIQCPVSVLATLLNKIENSWPGYICQQAWPTTQVSGFFFSILWYWKFQDFLFQKTTEMSQIYTIKTHFSKKKFNCLWRKKKQILLKKKSLLTSYLLCHIEPAPLNRTPSTACPMPIMTPFVDEPQLS